MMIKALAHLDKPYSLVEALEALNGPKSFLLCLTQLMTVLMIIGSNVSYIIFFVSVIYEMTIQTYWCDILISMVLFILIYYFSMKEDLEFFNIITHFSLLMVVVFYVLFIYMSGVDLRKEGRG